MKKLMSILFVLFHLASFGQVVTSPVIVADTTKLKAYNGTSALAVVTDSAYQGHYFKCTSCTVDHINIFQGVGKKWKRIKVPELSALISGLEDLEDDLANKQPINATLTALSGLAPTNNDFFQFKSGAIANRTPAQAKTDLSLVKGDVGLGNVDNVQQQPIDADLTGIAALTATTDNVIMSVSSAWASRTPTQAKTAWGINLVENTALSTWAGTANITTLGAIGTGTWNATAIGATKGGTGFTTYTLGDLIYSDGTNTLAKLAGNTTTAKRYLSQTGNGTISAVPVWSSLSSQDIDNNITLVEFAYLDNGTGNIQGQLDLKAPLSRNLTLFGAATAAQTLAADRTWYPQQQFQQVLESLGSVIVGQTAGLTIDQMTVSTFAAADGTVYWTAVWLPAPRTLTGVKFWLGTQGNFTGDNFNGIGLYTYSGGTCTQVAVSANDEAIWEGTGQTLTAVPFTGGTYAAAAGLYFVAFVRNSSAETTAPTFGIGQSLNTAAISAADFTNSAKLYSTHTGQTTLPATRLMSALTVTTLRPWVGLY